MAPSLVSEPSNYMQTLTTYLSNIMSSTLLTLPREIKELIYFDALSHAANMILVSLLLQNPSKVSPNATPLTTHHLLGHPPFSRSQKDKPSWSRCSRKRRSIPLRIRRFARQCSDSQRESR